MSDSNFGEMMKVGEAISLLNYGTNFEIKGSFSGKIYHRSWINKKEHAEQFYNETTISNPFYATGRISNVTGTAYFTPVIGIWMHDYYIVNKQKIGAEGSDE